jgi:hypothetical protein
MGKAISYCHDTYRVTTVDGKAAPSGNASKQIPAKLVRKMARRPWCLPERWATGRT